MTGDTFAVKSQVLFAAHRDGVFRYLCRIVGQRDAPDLTQEVFLRVARSAVPETTTDGERAWVFRIARNVALNHRRDTGRKPDTVELTEFMGQAAARPASQETFTAMREAIERLQALDRDVFLLREVAGLSYDEIAISCDIKRAPCANGPRGVAGATNRLGPASRASWRSRSASTR